MGPPNWLNKVKHLMREQGVKQIDLMSVFGVKSQGGVSHYFSGRKQASPEQLQSLASLFSVDVSLLTTETKSQSSAYAIDAAALTETFQTLARIDDFSDDEIFAFFKVYEKMGGARIAEAYDVITKLNKQREEELENKLFKLKKAQ
ncbi:hypothetical protein PCIT_a3060 [Pseudoalteromonas citrea]|uniref:HTH cro/C1-type domain-containing protein n=2 Tax=Pseudoalteromonas citrea TaxID=43655 RepID=A0AAD4AI40_9GAMM|nr:helix-turn-helix transcriptional regulator [Pseudoalteromonas citrea]KAF7770101.1 hypothetical protein PCIT_a3060 [Pseudoalteromonas citrea]